MNQQNETGSIQVEFKANDVSGQLAFGSNVSQSQTAVQPDALLTPRGMRRPSRSFSPKALRQILTDAFSDGELRELCFDLDVDYEQLPGSGKGVKVVELITYCLRHNRYEELVNYCREARPSAFAS